MSTATLTDAPAPVELTASDRCDSCGAAAKSQITLKSGGILLFCGHHTDTHREKLVAQGATIQS